jgi:hypothetical protein
VEMKKPDTDGGRCPASPSNKRRDLLVGSVANYFDIMPIISFSRCRLLLFGYQC